MGPVREMAGRQADWWRTAVVYQIYPRSFADADGDGVGDLRGIAEHLPHLVELGVDAVWLSPVYPSPMADAGYDVADYRRIDPLFGSLADVDELVADAHRRGLRVIMDLVPNHTSDEHAWFRAARAAPPGDPARRRYLFRDGRGEHGELPPNGWRSVFGGSAWSRLTGPDGHGEQWYLHLFDAAQPDLNWADADVRAEFLDILRFWADRGVDGFRIDVAHGLVKAEGLPDWTREQEMVATGPGETGRPPMWDQDGVHEIYRSWRALLDGYPGRVLIGEAWVAPAERLARYVRPDELHQVFHFDLLRAPWRAADIREAVRAGLAATAGVGGVATWVLSNHDVVRHPTRLTLAPGANNPEGIGPGDPQPDRELALRRGRAASAVMLALPGGAYLYQGEELGLPEHTTLPDDVRQDPTWFRRGGEVAGRDGCRVPLPWVADAPAFGFSPTGRRWLPQPDSFAEHAADRQRGVAGSTLELYRAMLAQRRRLRLGEGTLSWVDGFDDAVLAFRVTTPGDPVADGPVADGPVADGPVSSDPVSSDPVSGGTVLVVANLGPQPVALPDEVTVLLASGELPDATTVPTDVTVWVVPR